MNEKLDATNDKLDEMNEKFRKYFTRIGIAIVVVLVAIFVKDSSTGAKIASILALLKP